MACMIAGTIILLGTGCENDTQGASSLTTEQRILLLDDIDFINFEDLGSKAEIKRKIENPPSSPDAEVGQILYDWVFEVNGNAHTDIASNILACIKSDIEAEKNIREPQYFSFTSLQLGTGVTTFYASYVLIDDRTAPKILFATTLEGEGSAWQNNKAEIVFNDDFTKLSMFAEVLPDPNKDIWVFEYDYNTHAGASYQENNELHYETRYAVDDESITCILNTAALYGTSEGIGYCITEASDYGYMTSAGIECSRSDLANSDQLDSHLDTLKSEIESLNFSDYFEALDVPDFTDAEYDDLITYLDEQLAD